MRQVVQENLRKRDFKIDFRLPIVDGEKRADFRQDQKDLADAVFLASPSFLYPRLILEIRQPIIGNIVNTVIRLCQRGLPACRLRMTMPDSPDLDDASDANHVVYLYREGKVIEQQTKMCRDIIIGDDLMLHSIVVRFDKWRIETNVWEGSVTKGRPVLSLVQN